MRCARATNQRMQTFTSWKAFRAETIHMGVRDRDMIGLDSPPVTLDWDLNFECPELKEALRYWQSRCGGRTRPARANMNPAGMTKFLPLVTLVDVHQRAGAKREYRIRLAGSNVEQVYGNLTGRLIEDALPPAIAERWRNCLDIAYEADRPLRLAGQAAIANKRWLTGEILLAPLGDPDGPISTFFGVIFWRHERNVATSRAD
jgi:hypothetical protein